MEEDQHGTQGRREATGGSRKKVEGERWKAIVGSLRRKSTESPLANLQILEAENDAAAHRARRLHQIEGVAVLSHYRHIALREKISQVHENFHVSGEEAGRNGLPDAEVQVRISLTCRSVE